MKKLDLNKPKDARIFLTKALPEALPNKAKVDRFVLENGKTVFIKDLTDSQLVQYAWECLPIYRAAFPDLVDVTHEQ